MSQAKRQQIPANAKKKAVNLSVRADLIEEARSFGTNLSAVLEAAIENEHRRLRIDRWREENREAIQGWNRWVDDNGIPFSDLRSW
jgi:antitoxin CcdA